MAGYRQPSETGKPDGKKNMWGQMASGVNLVLMNTLEGLAGYIGMDQVIRDLTNNIIKDARGWETTDDSQYLTRINNALTKFAEKYNLDITKISNKIGDVIGAPLNSGLQRKAKRQELRKLRGQQQKVEEDYQNNVRAANNAAQTIAQNASSGSAASSVERVIKEDFEGYDPEKIVKSIERRV